MMFGGGMILAWLLPIIGGIFLAKYFIEQNKIQPCRDEAEPLTILKRRYANGEINQQEFNEYKNNILNA